jgi:hypothetical protein
MFDMKARAPEWASKVENEMRAFKYQDECIIADKTLVSLLPINLAEERLAA